MKVLNSSMRMGSSPLTRGAPYWRCVYGYRCRLIPAHAGSTQPSRTHRQHSKAHPRSRGEHYEFTRDNYLGWGSSPLTRGAQPF